MSKYEVIVKEVILTTYFIEAEDEEKAEEFLWHGDCPIDYTENLAHEVVQIIKVEEDV
jgi:hypothetical protein